jgi:predicted porin
VSSRFGFKGSSDIGNGMTAVGRYEFATVTDKEQNNIADLRLGYVGLSGGFGTVTVGNQWSAYFNHFGTIASPTYSLGYVLYSSIAGGPFRTSNTIKYANSFGPVSLDFDVRLNDSEEDNDVAEKLNGNGWGLGVSYSPMEALTLAIAADVEEENDIVDVDTGAITTVEDTDRLGIGAIFNFGGNYGVHLTHQVWERGEAEITHTQVYLKGAWGKNSGLLGFGQADRKLGNTTADAEPDSVFLGFYHNMGGGLRLYAEHTTVNSDEQDAEDASRTLLGMRFDF